MKKKWWFIPCAAILILIVAFGVYVSDYYRADETALKALQSDETVAVTAWDYGWLFDGPSGNTALIFYPGAKVEETAYAPFLHRLAAEGMDVMLVKMPFHLAIFGMNKAGAIMELYGYDNWYIGGHSLGGAMAANYAAKHGDMLTGLILCAAYPTSQLDEDLLEIVIYGSEDQVLNLDKVSEGEQYASDVSFEYILEGGNHAQFGNYGEQRGDGTASMPASEQQKETVETIIATVNNVMG